jgi:hypothetical protein
MSDERAKQDAEFEEGRPQEPDAAPADDRPAHVPDPTAMTGNLDTSGTGGAGGHSELRNIAPIFAVAEAHDMAYAARAVDPNDDEVPSDHVTVSTGLSVVQGDPEGDRQRVTERAARAQERLRDDPLGRNLDDRGTYVHDRRARDERAWQASVTDMGPATVIGPQELGEAPVAPNSVIDNRPEEEQRAPEGVVTQEGAREDDDTAREHERLEAEQAQGVQENRERMNEQGAEQATADVDAQEAVTVQGGQEAAETPTESPEAASEAKGDAEEAETPGPKSEELHAPEGDVKAPNKASSKTEWVEWATACGADRDEASSMTRLELISKYSKLRPNER